MGTFARKRLIITIIIAASLWAAGQVSAADRMFFSGISTLNSATGNMDVVLAWGELEGKIPESIDQFNIYRKSGSGDYEQINKKDEILNTLLPAPRIREFFEEPGEELQRDEVIDALMEAYPSTDASNYHTRLHGIMDPDNAADYNPLQKQFMTRYSRDAARALGRAFIDRKVPSGTYTYMITGVLEGSETKPLGRFTIDTTKELVLPAPEKFEQVRVGECSESRKNVDHARIHLNWRIPSDPAMMSVRALVYGYDLYRSETNLGPLGLRTAIPSGLVKVNDVPIIVSGNAPEQGLDAYLIKDDGESGTGGTGLEPGDVYYYYLAARDLAGKYSGTAGPLEATVPDTRAPAVPWNVHSQREEVGSAPFTPRLTLLWDQINNVNYLKQYGTGKEICQSTPEKVCHVQAPNTCEAFAPLCVDLDVVQYNVFRFASFQAASDWGTDTDGDLWPDHLEDLNENGDVDAGETDPCDPASHPAGPLLDGKPAQLVAEIGQTDTTHIRTLPNGKKMMFFQDPYPSPDNTVYWYRISAVDPSGNISPFSPPARAMLWDREQPEVNGTLVYPVCNPVIKHYDYNSDYCGPRHCEYASPDWHILTLIDETGKASSFKLYLVCLDDEGKEYETLLTSGKIDGKYCIPREAILGTEGCNPSCNKNGDYYRVAFFGADRFYAKSSAFEVPGGLCEPGGCVVLSEVCRDKTIILGGPGFPDPIPPGGGFNLCAMLAPGECAKIYRKVQGEYSPILSFCNTGDTTQDICEWVEFNPIVTTLECLSIRIFSENHVGSTMGFFPCATVQSQEPPPPLLESVKSVGDHGSPAHELRWSSQGEGMSAFIIQRKGGGETAYETAWRLAPDPETGQFVFNFDMAPGQIGEEFCYKVKGVDQSFQISDWSGEMCSEWGPPEDTVYLPWPRVPEVPDGGVLTAFYLAAENVGAIVLSEDLTAALLEMQRQNSQCDVIPNECTRKECLEAFFHTCRCNFCGLVKSWNRYDEFVVYRQQENMNFVQVSPKVETVHCQYRNPLNGEGYNCDNVAGSVIQDPLVFLVGLGSGSVSGVTSVVEGELEGTQRLIFVDWYPFRAGSKVRYHLMKINTQSKEPEKVFTSDWILMQ